MKWKRRRDEFEQLLTQMKMTNALLTELTIRQLGAQWRTELLHENQSEPAHADKDLR